MKTKIFSENQTDFSARHSSLNLQPIELKFTKESSFRLRIKNFHEQSFSVVVRFVVGTRYSLTLLDHADDMPTSYIVVTPHSYQLALAFRLSK
jgi:hypothetical protein